MGVRMILRNILQPLPDPKKEANKFSTSPLHHLFFDHIKEIVRIVIDEMQASRKFGLYIEKEHLEKEELFFLATVNGFGGIWHMRRAVPFEDAQRMISKLMWDHFEPELRHYFELAQRKNEAVRNKYNCHLESVRDSLLHGIYLVPNKAFHTA